MIHLGSRILESHLDGHMEKPHDHVARVGMTQIGRQIEGAAGYDILILDASYKQSLAAARSLGRAGLRVVLGESQSQLVTSGRVPAFRSRYCARSLILPSYCGDGSAFGAAVVDFVRRHPTLAILPGGDSSIAPL